MMLTVGTLASAFLVKDTSHCAADVKEYLLGFLDSGLLDVVQY